RGPASTRGSWPRPSPAFDRVGDAGIGGLQADLYGAGNVHVDRAAGRCDGDVGRCTPRLAVVDGHAHRGLRGDVPDLVHAEVQGPLLVGRPGVAVRHE